jgi:predicted dehydrogenase
VTSVALIGAGMWAPRLAAGAQRAGLDLVSVHARDHSAREALAQRFSCRAAATFEDAIA